MTLALEAVILFVDHQHGIAEGAKTADRGEVDEAAAKLAEAAKLYRIPVVVSAVGVTGEPKLTRRLRDALDESVPVRVRSGSDSFEDRDIVHAIEETGRKTVLIAGILTEVAVERPALTGIERGYRTQVVLDACNGKSERSENAAILRMTQSGVEMTSVPTIIGELARDFSDPRAERALALLTS